MLAGKPVAVAHTPAFGCSTKWKSKIDSAAAREAEDRGGAGESGAGRARTELKKLRANDTGKVLLVNFWATWCGPCITEFPEIEKTWRMFRRRDFDLVTVAANLPDEKRGGDEDSEAAARLEPESAVRRRTTPTACRRRSTPEWEGGVPLRW